MFEAIIIVILIIQGIANSYGFVREYFLANVEELAGRKTFPLSARSTKIVGLFWLLVCLLFLCSAWYLGMGLGQWKVISLIATVCSEFLIILFWKDSWAFTFFNVFIVVSVIWTQ